MIPDGVCFKGGANAAPVIREIAREFYAPIIPIVLELHRQGKSLRKIGAELERRKIKSPQGFPRWAAAQVRRALNRGLGKPTDPPKPRKKPETAEDADIMQSVSEPELCFPQIFSR